MSEKIYEVTSVALTLEKTQPPNLLIEANGNINTSGWKDARLSQYTYINPPADGIYEFDFIATPPEGAALDVITPVKAEYKWESFPSDLKGVKIYSQTNHIIEKLG